jgi:hypothetical protein
MTTVDDSSHLQLAICHAADGGPLNEPALSDSPSVIRSGSPVEVTPSVFPTESVDYLLGDPSHRPAGRVSYSTRRRWSGRLRPREREAAVFERVVFVACLAVCLALSARRKPRAETHVQTNSRRRKP